MKKLTIILFCLFAFPVFAEPGDTIVVSSLNNVDMTWYQGYEAVGVFPDTSKNYRKILMEVTLGCASTGCSDWDYTVQIQALQKLPDTTHIFELGRLMTPYGSYMRQSKNGFSPNWKHKFSYDVTDFAQILRDSVTIRAFYGGWSSGFGITVNFIMIEGIPPRDVLSVRNFYRSGDGGFNASRSDTFELKSCPPKLLPISPNAQMAMARIIPSGHGFVNSQNCAEFCSREYYLKTNDVIRYTQSIWRDDCGLNPVYPQGGTWLFDRANWCPGDKTNIFNHELTNFITPGSDLKIDMDFEIFTVTVPAGETPPLYILDAQLFEYKNPNFDLDAEIIDIISPSTADEHSRKNPICGNPIIKIRNSGATDITSLSISYGIKGETPQTYNWSGNLAFLESEIVELPILTNFANQSGVFEVSVSAPNGNTDEYADNNFMLSRFDTVPVYPNIFVIDVGTNKKPLENEWKLFDSEGNKVAENPLISYYEQHIDTIEVAIGGCFEFVLTDTDKDGLNWWNNNDGLGYATFRDPHTDSALTYFQADFGTEIRHQFMTSQNHLGVANTNMLNIKIYPNPAKESIFINAELTSNELTNLSMFNMMGDALLIQNLGHSNNIQTSLDLKNIPNGIYMLKITSGEKQHIEKVVVNK